VEWGRGRTEEEVRVWAYAINALKLIVPGDLSGAAGEDGRLSRYLWEFTAVSSISISNTTLGQCGTFL